MMGSGLPAWSGAIRRRRAPSRPPPGVAGSERGAMRRSEALERGVLGDPLAEIGPLRLLLELDRGEVAQGLVQAAVVEPADVLDQPS